jgi:hypothetical protein
MINDYLNKILFIINQNIRVVWMFCEKNIYEKLYKILIESDQ